jgi:hypothetical protein
VDLQGSGPDPPKLLAKHGLNLPKVVRQAHSFPRQKAEHFLCNYGKIHDWPSLAKWTMFNLNTIH